MLDLFAGLGGASAAMRDRGWEVTTVDCDFGFGCTMTSTVEAFEWKGGPVDLLWASPPCVEFTRASLPWIKDASVPSLALVQRTVELVRTINPRFWVLENVRGSTRYIRPLLGEERQRHGPFYLWGCFPPFHCPVEVFKQQLSGRFPERRAKIPYALSLALARACETVLF